MARVRFKTTNSKYITFNEETYNISTWAKKFGVTISCLSSRIKKYEVKYGLDKAMDMNWVPPPKRIYGSEHYESKIVELYNSGYTFKRIKESIECSYSTIKRFLVKNNITIRPPVQIPPHKKKNLKHESQGKR